MLSSESLRLSFFRAFHTFSPSAAMASPADEKSVQQGYSNNGATSNPNMLNRPRHRSRRDLTMLLSLALCIWLSLSYLPLQRTSISWKDGATTWEHPILDVAKLANKTALVPLEAHIMSKCPDARDCLRDLVVPAMEKIVDMVDFNLSFIGK